MSLFEKIYFTIFISAYILALAYWVNLAWFHPNQLKERMMQKALRNPDWLFFKGYSLKFTERHGILMFRLVTLIATMILLVAGILFTLGQLGNGK